MIYKSQYGDIFYKIQGPENAQVVVFTHGMGADHNTFDPQTAKIGEKYRTIVWDMPEHGKSFKSGEDFNFSVAAECLAGLLDETGTGEAVLVGQSLGGFISQYAAIKYPGRVRAVAVIGSTAMDRGLSRAEYLLMKAYSFVSMLIPWRMIKFFVKKTIAKKEATRRYIEKRMEKEGRKQLLAISRGTKKAIYKGMQKPVRHPLLITHGENEILFPRRKFKKWHKRSPESEYFVIPAAGHVANQDNPAEFNCILLRFLEKLNRK